MGTAAMTNSVLQTRESSSADIINMFLFTGIDGLSLAPTQMYLLKYTVCRLKVQVS